MKKTDITKDVKRLSTDISEYWEMELYHGAWFLLKGIPLLCAYSNKGWHERNREDIIPVPDIRDCLEKLREIGERFRADGILVGRNKTGEVHEALLSALLGVLKK